MDMSGVFTKLRNTLTNTVTEISAVLPGNPLLREYDAKDQIATAGPGYLWKIYAGLKKSTKAEVSIWVLEKKSLEVCGGKVEREQVLQVLRRGCMQLAKLKHPRVLTVEHVVEESRESLVMCTEPIFGVVGNLLGKHINMQVIPDHLKAYELNEVEIKYGLIQVSEGLDFLHNSAKIVHGNLCPASLVATKEGFWKLCGFDFTLSNTGTFSEPKFECKDWDTSLPSAALPTPSYLAPEYIVRRSCTAASDMYSLGMILYACYHSGTTLLSLTHHNIYREMPKNTDKLGSLSASSLGKLPKEVHEHIKMLLHPEPDVRPNAQQMSKLPFFDSVGVRTLQYLDSLLQRDNLQRSQFFKSLSNVLPQLPKRVQLQRLIPALRSELSNHNMIPFVLPNIFAVAEGCTDQEYLTSIFPCLVPVFKVQSPIQILLQLLKKMDFMLKRTPAHLIQAHILPMICASLDSQSSQIQELSLTIIPTFSKQLDLSSMKSNILPKIRKIILEGSTTALRVNSLVCMGKLITAFDRWTVQDEVLVHLHLVKSREPGVLMALLGVYKIALTHDKLGITKEMMTSKSLPFLIPLAFEGNLNLKQFDSFMAVVKDMLQRVEGEQRTKLEQIGKMRMQESADLEFTRRSDSNTTNSANTNVDKILGGGETTLNNLTAMKQAEPSSTLSLEDKRRLANMKMHETRMKEQGDIKPVTPLNNNKTSANNNKPKDLTSTLMSSNLSMISQQQQKPKQNNFMPTPSSDGGRKGLLLAHSQPVTWMSNNNNQQQQNFMFPVFTAQQQNFSQQNFQQQQQPIYVQQQQAQKSSLDTLMSFPSQQKQPMMMSMMKPSTTNNIQQQNQQTSNKLSQQDLLEFLG